MCIFLLYICIGMGAATMPMKIPTFGIFEHPYYPVSNNKCLTFGYAYSLSTRKSTMNTSTICMYYLGQPFNAFDV